MRPRTFRCVRPVWSSISASSATARPLSSAAPVLQNTKPMPPRSYPRPVAKATYAAAARDPAIALDANATFSPSHNVEDSDRGDAEGATTTTTSSDAPLKQTLRSALGGATLGIPTIGPGEGTGDASAMQGIDWSRSFDGLAVSPFDAQAAAALMRPIDAHDIEIKPDGIIYLPEIKYRRILNQAFGPGGWGLAPRTDLHVGEKVVTREFALIVHGRFVAQARGENPYFSDETIATAGEGCKSNALMRCCKDLGVASELWDPRFIRDYKKNHCQEIWGEHVLTKRKKVIWVRKGDDAPYPFKKTGVVSRA